MKFPPWDPPEPTDEQLLPFTHADTGQQEMRRDRWEQYRAGIVAEYKAGQKRSNTVKTIFDTYTVLKQIGSGGNGFVYQVSNSASAEFALKLLNPRTATSEKRKRFKNELGFCEKNRHKNIVTVVDHGLIENAPFYIMPCYSGSLRELMKNGIEPERVLPIFSQILDGIEAAHLLRVIHRDLKPQNILFDQSSETPIIADFGIAHFEEEELYTAVETKDGARLANFEYAAPEQCARGQHVDHRADIFALGLLLNEMFTNRLARGTRYKNIESVAPNYAYLDEIVSSMICSDPADRPNNIEAVKRQLRYREQEFFTQQRFSELKQTVVPTSDLDDPLIMDPPRLIDFDWSSELLTLILSKPVTDRWIFALRNIGDYSSVLGKGPERFSFHGDRATIPARESEVQQIIDHFKDWLPKAKSKYEFLLRQEKAQREEDQRRKLKEEIEAMEARERVRKNTRL